MSEKAYFHLDGQIAAVTGAGQGIGEAIARRLASAGARVAVLDLQAKAAAAVAGEIGGLGIECDVTSSGAVERAFQEIERQRGPVSILVNNAGITGRTVPLWELDERDLDAVYAVNLKGVFLCARQVIKGMLDRRYGRILNVASIAGKEGNPTMIPYSSTKAGVIGLTKALAKEVAAKGDITVNCIAPAVIRTKIVDGVAPETLQYMLSRIPMGRTGTLDEVASLVQYLVSREASFTTGQCYDISGGRATY
jgi:2-dehydro-3-deoxy-L-rhamnonate dehydrogenase (NAD+)